MFISSFGMIDFTLIINIIKQTSIIMFYYNSKIAILHFHFFEKNIIFCNSESYKYTYNTIYV
jgi:hypothetical protein